MLKFRGGIAMLPRFFRDFGGGQNFSNGVNMHWTIKLFIVLVMVFNIDAPNSYAAQNDLTVQNPTNINLASLNAILNILIPI